MEPETQPTENANVFGGSATPAQPATAPTPATTLEMPPAIPSTEPMATPAPMETPATPMTEPMAVPAVPAVPAATPMPMSTPTPAAQPMATATMKMPAVFPIPSHYLSALCVVLSVIGIWAFDGSILGKIFAVLSILAFLVSCYALVKEISAHVAKIWSYVALIIALGVGVLASIGVLTA
jgi:hypothetical protein